MQGRLLIISAPSGTGKTSVIQKLLVRHPAMIHSISWTTRSMRAQEKDGKDYHFKDEALFKKGVEDGIFAEWAHVHDCYYGTPKAVLDGWLKEKKNVLLDLDVQGAMNLKRLYGARAVTVFLLPPSEEELERRLSERKTDSLEQRKIRLDNAKKEMTFKKKYDYQVVNANLDQACLEIEKILQMR